MRGSLPWSQAWALAGLALALLVGAVAPARPARAQDDPTGYLPAGAVVLQRASADTDGDGQPDTAVLYLVRRGQAVLEMGLLVLRGPAAARQPHELFGPRPKPLSPNLATDPGSRRETDLQLRDLTADGTAELVVLVAGGRPEQQLWVFRWDGSEFSLQAALRGEQALVEADASGQPASLRQRAVERARSDGGQPWTVDSRFVWRDGGFRLASRAISSNGPPVGAEDAVLAHYAAIDRGDLAAAYALLTPAEQAARSYDSFAAGFATTSSVQVEELRALGSSVFREAEPTRVYLRVRVIDEAGGQQQARTLAGTWQVRQSGGRGLLEAPRTAPTLELASIAGALPSGADPLLTSQGDLRGSGRDDLALVYLPPGQEYLPALVVLLRSASGVLLIDPRSTVPELDTGNGAADFRIADVTADGRAELVYGAYTGAHSSLLAVLRWDGLGLAPLFIGFSNSPGLHLEDLDGDGSEEILQPQSGYCGSYAASPQIVFVWGWRQGDYRPATADHPGVLGWLFERPSAARPAGTSDFEREAEACVQHMLATGHAIRGEAAAALGAYRRYHELRASLPAERNPLPLYLGQVEVDEQLRDLQARAADGRLGVWWPTEWSVLRDLLGNNLERQAELHEQSAREAERQSRLDDAAAARNKASAARAAARVQYEAALALDPADPEARDGLARTNR